MTNCQRLQKVERKKRLPLLVRWVIKEGCLLPRLIPVGGESGLLQVIFWPCCSCYSLPILLSHKQTNVISKKNKSICSFPPLSPCHSPVTTFSWKSFGSFHNQHPLAISYCYAISPLPALFSFAPITSLLSKHSFSICVPHLTTELWVAMFTAVLITLPGMWLEFKNICWMDER